VEKRSAASGHNGAAIHQLINKTRTAKSVQSRVVGWSMQPDMRRSLVIDALEMAWFQRRPERNSGLIFHSDRGSQYASDDFNKVLKEYAITPSMRGKGNCWDNACSETLFGSLKVERLHGQRFETIRQAKAETIAWLLWYNQTRMHSTLCYASPIEFENEWESAQAKLRPECGHDRSRRGNAGPWKAREKRSNCFSHPSHIPWESIMPISTFPRHDYDEDEYLLKLAGLRDTHSEGKVKGWAPK
jgi:hypothetical protein